MLRRFMTGSFGARCMQLRSARLDSTCTTLVCTYAHHLINTAIKYCTRVLVSRRFRDGRGAPAAAASVRRRCHPPLRCCAAAPPLHALVLRRAPSPRRAAGRCAPYVEPSSRAPAAAIAAASTCAPHRGPASSEIKQAGRLRGAKHIDLDRLCDCLRPGISTFAGRLRRNQSAFHRPSGMWGGQLSSGSPKRCRPGPPGCWRRL